MGQRIGEEQQVDEGLASLARSRCHPFGDRLAGLAAAALPSVFERSTRKEIGQQVAQGRSGGVPLSELGDQLASRTVGRDGGDRRPRSPSGLAQVARAGGIRGFGPRFRYDLVGQLVESDQGATTGPPGGAARLADLEPSAFCRGDERHSG